VIHGAYVKAKDAGIRFESAFLYPETLQIEPYDLAVVLQNALENAIEACLKVEEDKRFISLKSRVKGEVLYVEIKNSFAEILRMDTKTNLPPTTKRDGEAHGLGLANIRRTAEKSGGGIEIALTEENGVPVFRLSVIMQGSTK
jgi:sensor histidine kinase regulating citrate/malate metabolism